MTEDPRFIKAWLKMARRIIQISKIESAKQYQKKKKNNDGEILQMAPAYQNIKEKGIPCMPPRAGP
jgi:hypothetical protein